MNAQTLKGIASTSLIAAALFSVVLVLMSGFEKGLIYMIELSILYFPIPFLLSVVILVARLLLTRVVELDTLIKNVVCGFVVGMVFLVVYGAASGSWGLQGLLLSPFSGLYGALVGGAYWFVVERELQSNEL